jgi:hypothetical protein
MGCLSDFYKRDATVWFNQIRHAIIWKYAKAGKWFDKAIYTSCINSKAQQSKEPWNLHLHIQKKIVPFCCYVKNSCTQKKQLL